jgi:hypothetical protein
VRRLLTGSAGGLEPGATAGVERAERVAVVLLDAFGWRFVERHAEHPLLRRIATQGSVMPLAAQFPSTTAAHVTTIHTGRPVGEHGVYEWNVYEPVLDAVVTPIIYSWAGRFEADSLAGSGASIRDIVPPGTVYQSLAGEGVHSVALQPAAFSPSTYDSVVTEGAELRPYDSIADGARELARVLAEPGGPRYVYLYWHEIDAIGHEQGPDSPDFEAACVSALSALEAALFGPTAGLPGNAVLLMTADHGQVATDPRRVDYLEDHLPGVRDYLRRGAGGRPLGPAGSARDVFLHTVPGRAEELAAVLGAALGERAEVITTAELEAAGAFGEVGPRLRARLADVCVLPGPGRMAWLREHAGVERRFRGHHGGMTDAESVTWLGTIPLERS